MLEVASHRFKRARVQNQRQGR